MPVASSTASFAASRGTAFRRGAGIGDAAASIDSAKEAATKVNVRRAIAKNEGVDVQVEETDVDR